MSTKKDLSFHLGETWGVDVQCFDQAGVAIDLTGAAVTWRVASKTAKIMDRTVGDGIVVTTPASGLCKIDVTPAMQTSVVAGEYRHELWVVLASGAVSVQVHGQLTVAPSLRKEFT